MYMYIYTGGGRSPGRAASFYPRGDALPIYTYIYNKSIHLYIYTYMYIYMYIYIHIGGGGVKGLAAPLQSTLAVTPPPPPTNLERITWVRK